MRKSRRLFGRPLNRGTGTVCLARSREIAGIWRSIQVPGASPFPSLAPGPVHAIPQQRYCCRVTCVCSKQYTLHPFVHSYDTSFNCSSQPRHSITRSQIGSERATCVFPCPKLRLPGHVLEMCCKDYHCAKLHRRYFPSEGNLTSLGAPWRPQLRRFY